ncbi:MAG: hypothetical protein AAF299_16365 [Pseudomonadota bacterium]
MVTIISKKDGPRREHADPRRFVSENHATIRALADHISGGAYSANQHKPEPPKPDGLVIHHFGAAAEPSVDHPPYVRISLNGRVVVVDGETHKQQHHIGEVRRFEDRNEFLLATRENNFYAPLENEISGLLSDLDHQVIDGDFSEDDLVEKIGQALGLK